MRLFKLLFSVLFLAAVFFSPGVHGQHLPRRQFSVVSENDNYTFRFTDRYYTNGLMLRYVQALSPRKGTPARLLTAEAGQQIFTPYAFNLDGGEDMDRPFTGYLYLKVLHTRIQSNGSLLQWGGQFGVVGAKAFGKEVQRWHHRTFGLKFPFGWEMGLRTGVGLNADARYVRPLLALGTKTRGIQLHATVHGQLGNLFVQGATGALLRLGAPQGAAQSAAFDTRVLGRKKVREWYFFYEPQLVVQGHNATLQGGWGQRVHNQYATRPKALLYKHQGGFVFAPHCWTVQAAVTHKGKEATTQLVAENWGSIAFSFRW